MCVVCMFYARPGELGFNYPGTRSTTEHVERRPGGEDRLKSNQPINEAFFARSRGCVSSRRLAGSANLAEIQSNSQAKRNFTFRAFSAALHRSKTKKGYEGTEICKIERRKNYTPSGGGAFFCTHYCLLHFEMSSGNEL